MVKTMENPIKIDDLGGKPTIFGNIHRRKLGKIFGSPFYPLGPLKFGGFFSRDVTHEKLNL